MADIIPLDQKLKLAQKEREVSIRRRKIQAVQKVFQCTHCALKCEKCGTQIDHDANGKPARTQPRIPYRFCEGCTEEYADYIERLKGRGNAECYWHNDDWMDLWRTWIDYQSSLDRYVKSKAFVQLMQDLKQTRPEQ